MELDPLDAGILRLLRGDARLSFREIAQRLGSTTPTVSGRVKALEDLGVVRAYRAEIDPALLGGSSHLVTLRARPAALARVGDAVAALPGVEEVLLLSGGSVQARIRLRPPATTLAGLHAAIATLDEVTSYDVAEVLAATPRPALDVPVGGLDVPCHQCHGPIHGPPVAARLGGRAHAFCCRNCLATFRERFERASRA